MSAVAEPELGEVSLKAEHNLGVADSQRVSVLLCQEAQLHPIPVSRSPSTYWSTPALGGLIPRDDSTISWASPTRDKAYKQGFPSRLHAIYLSFHAAYENMSFSWVGGLQGQLTHTPTSSLPDPDLAVLASESCWHRGH